MSTTNTVDLSKLPTEFRGCIWDDHWEFEAPCVVYFPKKYAAFKSAGNAGGIAEIVEDICMNISLGWDHNDGGLASECKWRGWGKRFGRRKDAHHVVIKIHWALDESHELVWREVSNKTTFGPPAATSKN